MNALRLVSIGGERLSIIISQNHKYIRNVCAGSYATLKTSHFSRHDYYKYSMSIYTRINEDFLDDLAQDAIINEPEAVHDDTNNYQFAVVIDGTAANEFVKPVLRVL